METPAQPSVLFLTDAHLGSGADTLQRERQLVAFLRQMQPRIDTLVLLGDMFDFWFTYRDVVPRGYTRFLGQLAAMADQGITIHYFIGNHDMWLFDYLEREIGVQMHDAPAALQLQGRRLVVGHGDGLDPCDRSYNLLKRIFRCPLNQKLFSALHPRIGFGVAGRWSESSRQSHGADSQQYQGDEREGIVQYALQQLAQQPVDYFIFGHRHGQVQRTLQAAGRTAQYINVGNWIERRDYALLTDGDIVVGQYQAATSAENNPV